MIHNTCQSEYGQLKSVIIKPVLNAFISDETLDSEWQHLNYATKPDLGIADREYLDFEKILQDVGVDIYALPVDGQVTIDSIYCRDTSIMTDHGVILCEMGKPDRKSEPAAIKSYFDALGIPILAKISEGGTLEGGDVAWLDDKTLAVGHSYRTNLKGIDQLTEILSSFAISVVTADLPHHRGPADVFHLMSILSPLAHDLALVYSPLMPISFRNQLIERGYNLVEVPSEEFETLGCNVLALAPRKCLMVQGNPITQQRLEEAGCEVITFAGEQICLPGGGGPTCLTRPLTRMIFE
jgi:N-dimethylarginine dimethylaminohydrolase